MTKNQRKDYIALIGHLLYKGKRYSEIAEYLNWQYPRVVSFCIRNNLKQDDELQWKRKEENRSELYKNIITDIQAGIKQSDIARKYNCSRQYVSQVKLGLKK